MAETLHKRHIDASHFHKCKPELCQRISMSRSKANPEKKTVRVACRMRAAWGQRMCVATGCRCEHNCYVMIKRARSMKKKSRNKTDDVHTEMTASRVWIMLRATIARRR